MRSIQNRSNALALALCLFIGIVTLVNFAVNIGAIPLSYHAFLTKTDWHEDFDSITQLMTARVIWHDWKSTELTDIDFYKLTLSYIFANNLIVFSLALIEISLLNCFVWLRQIPKLSRTLSTYFFCLVALLTPVIFLLSIARWLI